VTEVPDTEQLAKARAEIGEAIGHYADGWPSTAGGVVISFVVLAEIATGDGGTRLVEVIASGSDGSDGLPTWRRAGMLHDALYGSRIVYSEGDE
jgi:hypothetical protein